MIYILKSITYESKVIEKSRSRNCSNAHVLAHISRCFDDKKKSRTQSRASKKKGQTSTHFVSKYIHVCTKIEDLLIMSVYPDLQTLYL